MKSFKRSWLLLLLASFFLSGDVFGYQIGTQEKGIVIGGDYPNSHLSEYDITLMKELLKSEVHYPWRMIGDDGDWVQLQEDLKKGKKSVVPGATYSEERAKYANFSKPYRYEETALFIKKFNKHKFKFGSAGGFIDYVRAKPFHLGVVEGFVYADPRLNDLIKKPPLSLHVQTYKNDEQAFNALSRGRLDGILSDRLTGSMLVWLSNKTTSIVPINLKAKTPVHLMVSKNIPDQTLLDRLNKRIDGLKNTKSYKQIVSWYLYPMVISEVLDSDWFWIMEIIGTIAFAASGLIIAYGERTTLFGALIFALLPSFGGGLMRDIVIGRPVSLLSSPLYLIIVLGVVFSGYIALKTPHLPLFISRRTKKALMISSRLFVVFDAIGLGAFTVLGVMVAALTKADPLWMWGPFFAMMTGTGGGMLRDLLRKDRVIESLSGSFYPEIALLWGIVLSIAIIILTQTFQSYFIPYAALITTLGVVGTRLAVWHYNIQSPRFFSR